MLAFPAVGAAGVWFCLQKIPAAWLLATLSGVDVVCLCICFRICVVLSSESFATVKTALG